jgi:hypothetical protein
VRIFLTHLSGLAVAYIGQWEYIATDGITLSHLRKVWSNAGK